MSDPSPELPDLPDVPNDEPQTSTPHPDKDGEQATGEEQAQANREQESPS